MEKIKETIQETATEYKNYELVNPGLLWEMIKLKVRQQSIAYSASIKRAKKKRKEDELEKEISNLEKRIDCATGPGPLKQNANEE